MDPAPMRAGPA